MNLSEKLYSGSQIKALDKLAIETYQIPALELMGRAATACFEAIRQAWPFAKKFAVICGHGNNGGDGFALALMLHQDGFEVQVYSVEAPDAKISETAESARAEFLKTGLSIQKLPQRLAHVDLIIDALLGIGIKAPLKPSFSKAISLINQTETPVLAIDIPSGIDADTGAIIEQAVYADLTVCFIGLKYALFTGVAKNYTGHVLLDDLKIPHEIYEAKPWQGEIINLNQALAPLKKRQPAAHKGNFGHVLIVGGGNIAYSGAVALAGLASLNSGAGLTSGLVHPDAMHGIANAPLEMMCHPDVGQSQVWERASVIVIGPGLTCTDWAMAQWKQALSLSCPMVVDADALHLLAQKPIKSDRWVLTPHPGEAAALLGQTVEVIEADRVQAAKALQAKFGGVVVLKGAGTVICKDGPHFYLCQQGNPGMACGGMGDVLAGLIGSLLAQGLTNIDAAKLAVIIHAQAGDLEQTMGERGMLASELMLHIRTLINPVYEQDKGQDVTKLFDF